MRARSYRSALVTGASSGIGAALARALAARGVDVVLVARRADRLDRLAADLTHRHGITVEVLPADLGARTGLAAVEARLTDGAPVDLLVNNAGIGSGGLFATLPVDRQEALVQLNVVALVRLTSAALPGMLARRRGGVLNVSSVAGFQPLPRSATYAASKAFVTTFTESLAGEVAGSGVVVGAVCPGLTRTEFHAVSADPRDGVPAGLWLRADDVARDALQAFDRGRVISVPGRRWQAITFLARTAPRPLVRAATRRLRRG